MTRTILRVLGVALGVIFLVFAAYYAQLDEETLLRRVVTCANSVVLGIACLVYAVRGQLKS